MIYGIGIDLVRIDRMKDAADKWGRRFLERIFTEKEITYCYRKTEPYPSLAVRFAAKEALIKAMGEGFIPFTDIEITNDQDGRPSIRSKGRLEELFKERAIKRCHISLSHDKGYGIACVILEND